MASKPLGQALDTLECQNFPTPKAYLTYRVVIPLQHTAKSGKNHIEPSFLVVFILFWNTPQFRKKCPESQ